MITHALAVLLAVLTSAAQPEDAPSPDKPAPVRRPGSVDLHAEYDMDNLRIPEDEIHTLLPRDAIPALTDPELVAVDGDTHLSDTDRIIVVEGGGEVVGAQLMILNLHEVVNLTVGGEPLAATYCPLCDSATVISRTITNADGEQETLEFGVSGALYNSNVLMYDRTYKSLWSQLGMHAVSGPLAGTKLDHKLARIIRFDEFKKRYPEAMVLNIDTGYERDYHRDPYQRYFADDRLMVPVHGSGDALPNKTLGVGVLAGDQAWFITAAAIGDKYTLETPAGDVVVTSSEAGIEVLEAPDSVSTAQTFYYSWSAFNPDTKVIAD